MDGSQSRSWAGFFGLLGLIALLVLAAVALYGAM